MHIDAYFIWHIELFMHVLPSYTYINIFLQEQEFDGTLNQEYFISHIFIIKEDMD